MRKITNINECKLNNTIVTLGKFDGNHIGHRLLLDTAIKLKEEDQRTVIFTFDISPNRILNDSSKTILSYDERTFKGYENIIDYLVEFPFNNETKQMSAKDFIEKILVSKLGVKKIVVGTDFHFGKNRMGDVDLLIKEGKKYDFQVFALEKVKYLPNGYNEAQEVSSTLIKKEILKGNLEDVNNMLGSAFSITGKVLKGKQLGNKIGFPTINQIAPSDKVLPPDGVYATKTIINGEAYRSITNIGTRPTFDDGNRRTIETNIFNFSGDLYEENCEVDFYKFIRPERKFSGLEELKKEISSNVEETNLFFDIKDGLK